MKLRNEILRLICGFGLTAIQEIAGVTKVYTEEHYREERDNDNDKKDTKDQ